MWKDLLGTQHSLMPQFFFKFLLPDQRLYCKKHVYLHIYDCAEIVQGLPLLPNNTASETLLHK